MPDEGQVADGEEAGEDGGVGGGFYGEGGDAREKFLEDDAEFAAGEGGAEAEMDAGNEGEVAVGFAGGVEGAGVGEFFRVEIA